MSTYLRSYVKAIETMLGDWQAKDCATPLSKGYCSRSVYLDSFIEKAFQDQGFSVIRIYPAYIRYNAKDEVEHIMKQWFDEAIEKAKTVHNPLILLERVDSLYPSYHKFFANYVKDGIQIEHITERGDTSTQYVPFILCSSDDFDDDMATQFFHGYSQFIKPSRLDNCPSLQPRYNAKQDVNKNQCLIDTSERILAYQKAKREHTIVQDPNTGEMVEIKKTYSV
jgi:hypothetical protein